jgi:hypothetical protein
MVPSAPSLLAPEHGFCIGELAIVFGLCTSRSQDVDDQRQVLLDRERERSLAVNVSGAEVVAPIYVPLNQTWMIGYRGKDQRGVTQIVSCAQVDAVA